MRLAPEQIYCSLDLELTGFDPTVDEILEVGFLLFRIKTDGLEMLEEWSQVFRPSKDIRAKILALTGITNKEVAVAPFFSETRQFINQKLQGTVVVGHSVSVDIRFLQSVGIEVPTLCIDTLDMAQVLLPTHHSYNLENLMHYLKIKPRPSHRALADAEVTAEVLYALLGIGATLPQEDQQQLYDLAQRAGFSWAPLLLLGVNPKVLPTQAAPALNAASGFEFTVEPQSVISVTYAKHLARLAAESCQNSPRPVLLVVSRPVEVIDIWRSLAFTPVLNPAEQFSEKRFWQALQTYAQEPAALKFLCKVLVWKSLNWQSKSLLDLNVLFSGVQYKGDIVGGELAGDLQDRLLVTDYETFTLLAEKDFYADRTVLIESVENFFEYLSSDLGVHVSWNQVLYTLRAIYNPESDTGLGKYKQTVLEAIAATDLFYGLVQLLLKHSGNSNKYVKLESVEPFIWAKVERAGRHYLEKLRRASGELRSEALSTIVSKLDIFFEADSVQIRWVEVSDARCALVSKPLEIAPVAQKLLNSYREVAFIGRVLGEQATGYYQERLGLSHFSRTVVKTTMAIPHLHLQGPLASERDLASLTVLRLPTVLLFDNYESLKSFYESFYGELRAVANVFALGYNGGPNKLLRNFTLKQESILIATVEFLAKYASKQLPVANLIFASIPSLKQPEHPYAQALGKQFPSGEKAFATLVLREQLYKVMQSTFSPILEDVYMFGPMESELLKDVQDSLGSSPYFR